MWPVIMRLQAFSHQLETGTFLACNGNQLQPQWFKKFPWLMFYFQSGPKYQMLLFRPKVALTSNQAASWELQPILKLMIVYISLDSVASLSGRWDQPIWAHLSCIRLFGVNHMALLLFKINKSWCSALSTFQSFPQSLSTTISIVCLSMAKITL